jgi:acetyltransferase-like isoleucine patch superfamily enzyme
MLNRKPVGKQVIIIGSNIWLDAETIIFKGIITGTSSPVSTGLLVNKPVPPYQMWAGSSARFVRNRD